MGSSMRVMVPIFLLLASIVATVTESAMTCETIGTYINPCTQYPMPGEAPRDICCDGFKKIKKVSENPSDRFVVCICIKYASRLMRPVDAEFFTSLADKCRVDLPYKFDRSINCTTSLN